MANRDLLKEAIADAKTVKETAIANAKAALEESFGPYLRQTLAAKLSEIDNMEENEEMYEAEDEFTFDEKAPAGYGEIEVVDDYTDDYPKNKMAETEEMDLDELLKELGSMDEGEDEEVDINELIQSLNEDEGMLNDPKKSTSHGNVAEAEEEEEEESEEFDIENMDEDDLKSFIESVIADMVANGELEAGHEGEYAEEEEEETDKDADGVPDYMDQELDEIKKLKAALTEAKAKNVSLGKELKEAYGALKTVKTELTEVNLFNAKLLYTNKIFKAKNLTESQKVKVLTAFDKASSVNEAKLVFETLSEGLKEKKSPVNESLLRGSASKPAGIVEKKPILEVNNQYARWQVLAGIKKTN